MKTYFRLDLIYCRLRRSGTKKKKRRKEKKTKDEIRDELFGLMMFQEKDSEVQVKKLFWNPGPARNILIFRVKLQRLLFLA